jgi:hypothetical protein
MKDEVIGGWRELRNEELHNLYSSQSTIIKIKSRRMKRAEHIVLSHINLLRDNACNIHTANNIGEVLSNHVMCFL